MEDGVDAPRILRVPFPYNVPIGDPGDREDHKRVALAALRLPYELEEPAQVILS